MERHALGRAPGGVDLDVVVTGTPGVVTGGAEPEVEKEGSG